MMESSRSCTILVQLLAGWTGIVRLTPVSTLILFRFEGYPRAKALKQFDVDQDGGSVTLLRDDHRMPAAARAFDQFGKTGCCLGNRDNALLEINVNRLSHDDDGPFLTEK